MEIYKITDKTILPGVNGKSGDIFISSAGDLLRVNPDGVAVPRVDSSKLFKDLVDGDIERLFEDNPANIKLLKALAFNIHGISI